MLASRLKVMVSSSPTTWGWCRCSTLNQGWVTLDGYIAPNKGMASMATFIKHLSDIFITVRPTSLLSFYLGTRGATHNTTIGNVSCSTCLSWFMACLFLHSLFSWLAIVSLPRILFILLLPCPLISYVSSSVNTIM